MNANSMHVVSASDTETAQDQTSGQAKGDVTPARIEIEFRGVSKAFTPPGSRKLAAPVVKDLNLKIRRGEVVSLIGPSGCGKSTLLNMGSGLYKPTEGNIIVAGQEVLGPVKRVAFMLQKDLLMPWRNIRKNVEVGMQIAGVPKAERLQVASEMLEKCHLKGFENHYPFQLSGGMRQRAALARTLAMKPDVLFLDEPFSALDAQTKMVLQQDLAQTLYNENKTALLNELDDHYSSNQNNYRANHTIIRLQQSLSKSPHICTGLQYERLSPSSKQLVPISSGRLLSRTLHNNDNNKTLHNSKALHNHDNVSE